MKITEIDYRSDFTLRISVKDMLEKPLALKNYDFEGVITSGANGTAYTFSRTENQCTPNCYVDDDDVIVCKFDNHGLQPGRLILTFTIYVPDSSYPDGTRKDVAERRLDVKLVDGKCPIEYPTIEAELILPTLKGDKGDKGDRGEKGDKGDTGTITDNTGGTINGDLTVTGSVKASTLTPGSGSGGVLEVDGQLVTKGWGVMANGDSGIVGNLTVSGAAYADGLHADKVLRLDKEDVGAMLVHVFHGIRQSLPTDYTAATLPLTPKTCTDGVADIIYVREKKRFYAFWEAQKAYAERFDGDAEYNVITNNKPTTARTDRTWRCAGKLYAWDAEFALKDPNNLLSAYVGDLTCLNDSAKEAFIKSWNEAFYKNGRKFGEYNRETGYFEGNGLTDITYEQAKIIMKFVGICQNPSSIWRKIDGGYSHGGLGNFRFDYYGKGQDSRGPRTFPPIVNGASGGVYNSNHLLQGDICLQAASFAGSGGLTGNEYVFDSCRNLRYVLNMELNDTQGKKTGMFAGCVALETVELKYLTQGTVSFEQSPKLTLDSIKYMLNNRRKDGDMLSNEKYKFTIKLHADVFAKLTDDIIALATEMNATLVSA